MLVIAVPGGRVWMSPPPMKHARYDAVVALVDGLFYVIGGFNDSGHLRSVEVCVCVCVCLCRFLCMYVCSNLRMRSAMVFLCLFVRMLTDMYIYACSNCQTYIDRHHTFLHRV